jgi:hypothetical protein
MANGTEQPSQPFQGVEYPALENSPPTADPYAVDYPANPGLPPPVYPPPYPGTSGYPGGYPGFSTGYPYPVDPYRPQKPPGTNGKAIAALVTALAGLLFCGLPSIAGLILGIVAMRETRRSGQYGYGIALAGTIIGALVVTFWSLYWVVVIGIVATGWQYAP